jgi:hypothetical protein
MNMLQVTPATLGVRPTQAHQEPVTSTTDKVMKGGHDKYGRAAEAARVVCGLVEARPSIAAAAREYRVSPYLVRTAMRRIRRSTVKPVNIKPAPALPLMFSTVWACTSPIERDRFVAANLGELWDRIDHATAPKVGFLPSKTESSPSTAPLKIRKPTKRK